MLLLDAAAASSPDSFTELAIATSAAFVVLAEVQPMQVLGPWTAAGGGLTNTYYSAFASQVETDVVPGGIYRRLDFVRQNATTLTSRASAALVNSNLGSYFYDIPNARIYVSLSSGLHPNTAALVGAWFSVFCSTDTIAFPDQPLYTPLIAGDLPVISSEMPDTLFGAINGAAGALTLLNGNSLFDRLSRLWVWRNKKVTFKLGGVGLDYTDFVTIGTMRVNGIDVDDEVATLTLEDEGSVLNQSLPLRTWGDGTLSGGPPVTNPEAGINGQSQPLVFGYVRNCPLAFGGLTALGKNIWYAYDSNAGAYGSCQFVAVYAIDRTTRTSVQLTPGVDYTTSGSSVTILDTTYPVYTAGFDIFADLRQIGTIVSETFGSMALAILRICGESDSNIDLAAFTIADSEAPQILSRYVGEPIIAADLMRELEQSVNGQVYKGLDGRWTCRVIKDDLPASLIELSDADFVSWVPTAELRSTLNEVRVRYGKLPIGDSWTEVSSSDDAVLYGSETSDSHRLDTWLTSARDASALAQHLRFRRGTPATTIAAEKRGLEAMLSSVGDLVSVTRSRAPNARTGRYDGHLLRLVKIDKSLGGECPIVKVWLNDLDGQTDHIARYAAPARIAWTAATEQERARYGFYSDANGYVDASDPVTRKAKVYS